MWKRLAILIRMDDSCVCTNDSLSCGAAATPTVGVLTGTLRAPNATRRGTHSMRAGVSNARRMAWSKTWTTDNAFESNGRRRDRNVWCLCLMGLQSGGRHWDSPAYRLLYHAFRVIANYGTRITTKQWTRQHGLQLLRERIVTSQSNVVRVKRYVKALFITLPTGADSTVGAWLMLDTTVDMGQERLRSRHRSITLLRLGCIRL